MSARLVVIRHGRSAHVGGAVWLDRVGMTGWRAAYDAAGIAAADAPPATLMAMAAKADRIIASDLPRALASAQCLAPGRAIEVSPMLRETPLPIPQLPVRLPLALWEALIHLRWGVRIAVGVEATPAEVARAAAAAAWLSDTAGDRAIGLVVTHGVFRRLLSRQLVSRGWRTLPGRRRYGPWSSWGFERD
jgi:broad specificity phosphatase PhoE